MDKCYYCGKEIKPDEPWQRVEYGLGDTHVECAKEHYEREKDIFRVGEFLEDNRERAHTPVEIGGALNMNVLDTWKPLMALIKKRLVTRDGKYYRWIGYSMKRR